MTFVKVVLACSACSPILLYLQGDSAHAQAILWGCKAPETGTREIPIFSPPLSKVVTGTEKLQFYIAPNFRCLMDGVFVAPKDELIAYAQSSEGWSSVMIVNPKTGQDVSGWVRSARLKEVGTVGPKL